MKLRNIFFSLLAGIALVGCNTEVIIPTMSELQLSSSYISIPQQGGNVTIDVTATNAWVIDATQIAANSWLTVSPASGQAGETSISLTAEETATARKISDFKIYILGEAGDTLNTQFFNIEQPGLAPVEVTNSTCAEVIAGPDNRVYRISGPVTSIANTEYGNWYLNDGTGEVYIYGTLDKNGAEKNFLSLGIAVGDIVTVEGPKTTYNSVVELVNVTVLSITKSLVSVVTEEQTLPKEGGEFEVQVAFKGEGVYPTIPAEYRSWVSIVSINSIPGVPTSREANPADTAIVTLSLAENLGGDRNGSVTFTSAAGGVTSSQPYNFMQSGAIIDATVAEFLAAAEGPTMYRVNGVISNISVSAQYHNASVTLVGGLGEEILLYRAVGDDGNIEDLNLQVGDIATFIGKRSSYNGTPQMAAGGKYVSHVRYDTKTIEEFIAAEVGNTIYTVTGVIDSVQDLSASYNNVGITIKDSNNNTLLCYRATTFDGSNVGDLTTLVAGSTITISGKRSAYNNNPQMGSGKILLITPAN